MKLQLKPGDYVSTKGMTEEQYHAVCKRFIECGCPVGEYSDDRAILHYEFIGWANNCEHQPYNNKLFHGLENGFKGKIYTVFEILFCDKPEIWNGTGLPPVGANAKVREKFKSCLGDVIVIAHDMDSAVARYTSGDSLGSYCAFAISELEPIKSDREKAIDEMVAIIRETEKTFTSPYFAEDPEKAKKEGLDKMLGAIYDAGYRKQESEK